MSSRRAFCVALLALCGAAALWSASLDLGGAVFYARKGFDPALISTPPSALPTASGQGWAVMPAGRGKSHSIRNFGIPGEGPSSPFALQGNSPGYYTILCVFDVDMSLLNTTGLSLLIPQAGQGWALYLNGTRIHNELYVRPDGSLDPERSLRNVIVPVDKRSLVLGKNVLAFEVYGDSGDERTGLSEKRSLALDSYGHLSRSNGEYLDIALIGIYALFAVYHFVLFALRPKHSTYIIYGLGALVFSLFLFSRSASAATLIPNTAYLRIAELGSLFLVLPILTAFCETALGRKTSAVSRASFCASLALAILLPFVRQETLRLVWEILAGIEVVYLFAAHLVPRLVELHSGSPERPRLGLGELFVSDAGLLSVGSVIFAAAALVDVLAVNGGGEMRFTKYAFLIFVIVASAILAGQFDGVYGELEGLGASLERKVAERTAQIEAAAEGQRSLGVEIERQGRKLRDSAQTAERDLALAERVQQGFFPASPPEVDDWDIALTFRPAARVSGDFYDFYVEDGRLAGLCLGDVSGHGIGAGLVSVLARSVFSRRWPDSGAKSLGEFLASIHGELSGELGGVDEYLTCLVLRFEEGKVEYANAAHPDLLYRRAGAAKALAVLPRGKDEFRGPPIGKSGFEGSWSALRFSPGPGDLLFAYTDCFEEAKNADGERYGRERLLASLSAANASDASSVLLTLITDLENFSGSKRFDDDLTAIVLRRRT